MNQLALFDYQQLDTETRIVVQQRTNEIKALMKRTAQDIIEIGDTLIDVKERLGHGYFGAWLEKEFSWSWDTANNFMRVADKFRNFQNLENFAPSALYLLARNDEARQEAIERAQNGESITHNTAKEIVNGYKIPATPELFPDERRPYVLYPDGHKEFTTLESIQETKRLLDEKGIDYFTCPICQDMFDKEVWHCPKCDHHWPLEKEQCSNCYNYKRDNRRSQSADIYTPQGMDACQTPPYAIDPLLTHLPESWNIWEPAAGEGYLEGALYDSGFSVTPSDILTGQNFFEYEPDNWDCIITNPPYSIQFQWLERCYQLGKPFALLLKVEILGTKTAQELMQHYGFEILLLDKRVDFKMPRLGWGDDERKSNAQFPTFWLCWQLLPEQVMFGKLQKEAQC